MLYVPDIKKNELNVWIIVEQKKIFLSWFFRVTNLYSLKIECS
jgi:hypothetical protein